MLARCLHPRALQTDPESLVHGPVTVAYFYASVMRQPVSPCGPLGKLWEPKEKHYDQEYAHMDACAKAGVSESGPSR